MIFNIKGTMISNEVKNIKDSDGTHWLISEIQIGETSRLGMFVYGMGFYGIS